MKAWLLVTVPDGERSYQGNTGYDDDQTRLYRYDSNVPNSKRLAKGDLVVLRGKTVVLGSAFVSSIQSAKGKKTVQKCPTCGQSRLKRRRKVAPPYRCECGEAFDQPVVEEVPCEQYEADFGDSFLPAAPGVTKTDLWQAAVKLNKQFAILELDAGKVISILALSVAASGRAEEFPISSEGSHNEGHLRRVYVNKYERNPEAREKCLAKYGRKCQVCGMDFASVYGKAADRIIHVHHVVPLATIGRQYQVNPIKDLIPVCPNCHAVIHLRVPPFSITEVQQMLETLK